MSGRSGRRGDRYGEGPTGCACGLSLAEALADPIVQALVAADRIDPENVAALMRRMAARLASRARSSGRR
jgi:hypothetical protein